MLGRVVSGFISTELPSLKTESIGRIAAVADLTRRANFGFTRVCPMTALVS
jgi:hypothetical protein